MLEKFTKGSRLVMAKASQIAQRMNHNAILAEHVLLGILEVQGSEAVAILETLGKDPVAIRKEVEKRMASDGAGLSGRQHMAFTAKVIVDKAISETRALKSSEVGIEHLLLGVLDVQACVAAQVLVSMGVDVEAVRGEAVRVLPTTRGLLDLPDEKYTGLNAVLKVITTIEEARRDGVPPPPREHLIVALLQSSEEVIEQTLTRLGITTKQLCEEILRRTEQS